jgi:hypothetical protein
MAQKQQGGGQDRDRDVNRQPQQGEPGQSQQRQDDRTDRSDRTDRDRADPNWTDRDRDR